MSPPRTLGRPRTIDRSRLLDVVEEIVTREGVTALTIDAVAKAAGITKGGVQYCFGTKDDLIAAMIERWLVAFDACVAGQIEPDAPDLQQARGYVMASGRFDETTQTKMVGMLVTLLQVPQHLGRVRSWYANWIGKFDPDTDEGRRARAAFFAAEGAFFLRSLGLVEMSPAEWDKVFTDFITLFRLASSRRVARKPAATTNP